MKVVFINPTNFIFAYGLRCLVSYIERNGHDVKMIFMPVEPLGEHTRPQIQYQYPPAVYKALDEHLQAADIVGVSFVSNFFGQARFISQRIKKNFPALPLVWGGIHATALPEQALEYCDSVCVGEGEAAFSALLDNMAQGLGVDSCRYLWTKRNGATIPGAPSPLIQDLDSCPFPFFDTSREFVRVGDTLAPMDNDLLKKGLYFPGAYFKLPPGNMYMTMSSRGCPNRCAYCCNNLLSSLYRESGSKVLRRRSPSIVVDEIAQALHKVPNVTFIAMLDDDFLATTPSYIEEFSQLYKQQINLPFKCNMTPVSATAEKIASLRAAGLISAEMGIQSASDRVNRDIFRRRFDKNKFIEAARIIRSANLIACYDVILDNPFETVQETIETILFLGQVPKPFILSGFSLTFFPGTEIYKMAKDAGFITDEETQIYNKKNNIVYENKDPYIKFLVLNAASARCDFDRRPWTRKLLLAMTSRPALLILNRPYFGRILWPLLSAILKTPSKLKAALNPNHPT